MSTRNTIRQLLLTCMLLFMLVLLSACANGEAHVTVNTDGSADLALDLSVSDSALGKIGQDNVMPLLAEALERNHFKAEITKQGDQNVLKATNHYERSSMTAFDTSKLPTGIHIEQSTVPGFFSSKMHITADADLMESMPDGDIKEQINKVPGFLKRLLLKDMNFNFKLSLPIKADASNADEVQDGGKTLIWNISPLQKNTLDLTVQIPNIRNILLVAIPGLVLILALLIGFFIRRKRMRRQ
ncbi:DUF3153 domain-containing protein [Paenibacillus barcinonensis]|uniref:DUF3153 domain-containing protein n=1 Tax=Paenibacillus barcinonensis TaxID=198119 RepID=A0A2V4VTM9_PAEBA|nr:DUF3153 domain-containing protein [Paenibacillus barcinonensis]PYE50150.1 uncharacterized protein DUF3153 [Paenibacillus barcinonensis]QKS59879.1 DUF3153 domain-containing protein [Paenibacillus barcinonensis]